MAAYLRHISLLLFGLVILTIYSARVEAGGGVKIVEKYTNSADQPTSSSGLTVRSGGMRISWIDNLPLEMTSTGRASEIIFNGNILRGINIGDNGVIISGNKIFLGKKLICDNINKASGGEPTYQKMDDGSLWYTNIKIGEPMNKAEIDKFDADWAVHKKEEEERAAKRERQHEQSMDEYNKRIEEHKKQMELHTKQVEEHNKRMEKHKKQMEEQKKTMGRAQPTYETTGGRKKEKTKRAYGFSEGTFGETGRREGNTHENTRSMTSSSSFWD